MSDFKREERYIVVKVKDMDNITEDALRKFLIEREIQTVGGVVTEEDWPNYEHVWQTIEQVANGTFDPDEITRLQAENEALRARVAEMESDIFSACAEVLEREADAIGAKQGLGRRMARLRIAFLAQRLRTQADEIEND